MSIGKREKTLLIILGLVIYAYLFYTFVWVPVIPQISSKNEEMAAAVKQKEAMDSAVKNIDGKRIELDTAKVTDERLNEYLMSNANIADSMDYIEKLSKLLGKEITDVNISRPEEKSTATGIEGSAPKNAKNSGKQFYELKIEFKTKLAYAEAADLVKYIEGGSRKVRISKFTMEAPKVDQATQNSSGAGTSFDASMTINLYSLNMGNIDKIYEYSMDRFNRYMENGGSPFVPVDVTGDGNFELPKEEDKGASSNSNIAAVVNIKEESFLAAGDNLQITGSEGASGSISVKTKSRQEIRVTVGESSYTVETAGSNGKPVSLQGSLAQGDLNIQVGVDFPMVKENNDLGLNIKIINNSSRKVSIMLSDKGEKAKILDRTGNVIYRSSETEKVQIM